MQGTGVQERGVTMKGAGEGGQVSSGVPSGMSLLPSFLKCKNPHLASWGLLGLPPLLFGAPNLFLVYSHGNHWGSGVLGTSLLLWWEMSGEKCQGHSVSIPNSLECFTSARTRQRTVGLGGFRSRACCPDALWPHSHLTQLPSFWAVGMRPQLPRSFPHTHHGRYGSYMLPILGTYR